LKVRVSTKASQAKLSQVQAHKNRRANQNTKKHKPGSHKKTSNSPVTTQCPALGRRCSTSKVRWLMLFCVCCSALLLVWEMRVLSCCVV
jgi:hypothetical protein